MKLSHISLFAMIFFIIPAIVKLQHLSIQASLAHITISATIMSRMMNSEPVFKTKLVVSNPKLKDLSYVALSQRNERLLCLFSRSVVPQIKQLGLADNLDS